MKGTRKMDNTTNKHEFACNAGKVTEYEVKEHIDTIMVGFRGFSKEVSIVKWNDKKPVFDIRAWRVSDRDGLQYPLRGITFSKEEFIKLKDVIRLFERSFAKVTVYKETDPNGKTHRKPERGITTTKPHEWVLKVYDKTFQQRQAGNLKVESNLIRVELVFLDRMLDRMYSTKKSLEDILCCGQAFL